MTTINRTQSASIKKLAQSYILNAIDGEGYGMELLSDQDKLQFLADTLKVEYGYNLSRYGTWQETLRQWIMGLPSSFNIDFENYKILEISKAWGSIPANATEKQEDKIIENWFNFIAANTLQLMARHGVSLAV